MQERAIFAGFGGQGVMSMGKLLTYAGMIEGKEVSWLPSYGPEMRGGTANCHVTVSDTPVGSPVITNDATCLIAMNLPSLIKFEEDVVADGVIFVNSSLIDRKVSREDVRAFYVPANEIASELGNLKVANMVMLGAYLKVMHPVTEDSVVETFHKLFTGAKEKLIPMNEEALKRGAESVVLA